MLRRVARAAELVSLAAVLHACDETAAAIAGFDVTGSWAYQGTSPQFSLRGTIDFVQTGAVVAVTGTTYENADDRELVGQATLDGRRLEIELVPANGDDDYRANVTFSFSEDGESFDVAFADTNFDEGEMGSYRGSRR